MESGGYAQETVYKVLSFPPDNADDVKVQNYTSNKDYTIGSDSWAVTNFNNNNWDNWKYIKCGSKSTASVATISTKNAYDAAITKVVLTLDAYKQTNSSGITLVVASDANFTDVIESVVLAASKISKGDVVFDITNPSKECFYKLTFACKKSSNGGTATVSKVQYIAQQTGTATKISFNSDFDETKTYTFTEGVAPADYTQPLVTLNTAEAEGKGSIVYKSDNTAVVDVDESTGILSFEGKTLYDTEATISAQFISNDGDVFTNSNILTYKVKNVEKVRTATTLDFEEESGSVNLGEPFSLPTLTLKAGGETLTGKSYTYTSSNKNVATVDENTGAVTLVADGKTTITATYAGDDDYTKAEAAYELTVVDPNIAETSFVAGIDKGSNGSNTSSDKMTKNGVTISSKSCALAYSDNYRFYTASPVTISSPNRNIVRIELVFASGFSGTMFGGDGYDQSTCVWTGDAKSITLTPTQTKQVKVLKFIITFKQNIETVTLDETDENLPSIIASNADKAVNVTLNRTISSEYLNPVCLPFDLTEDRIAEVFGEGSVVSEYTSVTGSTMNFAPVTSMKANMPYIVKATESFETKDISDVTLKTIVQKENVVSNMSDDEKFIGDFVGSPSIVTFTSTDGTELFLGKDGNLYRPTENSKMKGMRAYFEVINENSGASEAKVNIGGGTTTIGKLMNGNAMTGKVYNLNGQYVGTSLDGLAKGLYIMNGKMYVVK